MAYGALKVNSERDTPRAYSELPWYRKSGVNSVLMILHFLTCGFLPLLLITCLALVTGKIYYNEVDEQGKLKSWSVANKILAYALLLIPLLFIGAIFSAIAGF